MRHTARQKLREIRAALRNYHHALDTRQHGGVAGNKLIDDVQRILKNPWVQGATLEKETAYREECK